MVKVDTTGKAQLLPVEITKGRTKIKTQVKDNKLTVEVSSDSDSVVVRVPKTVVTNVHKEDTKEVKTITREVKKPTPSWIITGAVIGYGLLGLAILSLFYWLRKKFFPW